MAKAFCAEAVPDPRSGHRTTFVHNMLISYGGYTNVNHKIFTELWIYSIYQRIWKKCIISVGTSRNTASSALATSEHFVFAFGGTGFPFGRKNTNELSCFNLLHKTWTVLSRHSEVSINFSPPPGYGYVLVYYKDKLYVHGGTDGYDFFSTTYCFCLKLKKWIPMHCQGSHPLPRYRHHGVVYQDKLYILGGKHGNECINMKTVDCLDFATNTWAVLNTTAVNNRYPCTRCFESMAFQGNVGYLSGGIDETEHALKDIWMFSLDTLQWTRINETLSQNCFFHSSCLTKDGQLVVFGGAYSTGVRTNRLEVIQVWPSSLYSLSLTSNINEFCQNGKNYLPHILTCGFADFCN